MSVQDKFYSLPEHATSANSHAIYARSHGKLDGKTEWAALSKMLGLVIALALPIILGGVIGNSIGGAAGCYIGIGAGFALDAALGYLAVRHINRKEQLERLN